MRITPPPPRPSKIRLHLLTPEGGDWALTMSVGMVRFIGPYSRVPGLGSEGLLLEYQPVGRARS